MATRIHKGARHHLYITEWRVNRGLSLDALANRIGVAENTVWRWENEQHRLNPEKIANLAHHLDLDDPTDLWRPPPTKARPSLDAMVKGAPDELYDMAFDVVRRLIRKTN